MSEQFWDARPVLQHVLALARARAVGPWAVLGAAMARALATVPPDIALPATVGGRMSLNLFVALVGPSGGGKGASEAAAADGLTFGGQYVADVPLGSGEGFAKTFRPPATDDDGVDPVVAAIFHAPEIDTLTALTGRQGSTLSAELRKAYSGEQLGFGNAGKDTRVIVAAHSYRACLVAGVQPLRSQALLSASDGGLPQRFVWLPTTDPDASDQPPDDPVAWKMDTPSWLRTAGSTADLTIPDNAATAIRGHRLAVLRQDTNVDPLDGHALLTRLKVAAALMALDGRTLVSDEDWKLAGVVMTVSDRTREQCQRALADQSRSVNTARALATADRDEVISDHKLRRCKEGILRWVAESASGQRVPHNKLRRGLKSDLRENFGAAVQELLAEKRITEFRTPKGTFYGGPPVDRRSTTSDLREHGVDRGSTVDRPSSRNRRRTRGKHRSVQQTSEAS